MQGPSTKEIRVLCDCTITSIWENMHTHAGVIWQLQDGANAWYINSIEWGQSQEKTCLHMDLRATYELWRSKSPLPPKKQTRSWPNMHQQWMYHGPYSSLNHCMFLANPSHPTHGTLAVTKLSALDWNLGNSRFRLAGTSQATGRLAAWRHHLKLDPMTKVVEKKLTIVTHRNYIYRYYIII